MLEIYDDGQKSRDTLKNIRDYTCSKQSIHFINLYSNLDRGEKMYMLEIKESLIRHHETAGRRRRQNPLI